MLPQYTFGDFVADKNLTIADKLILSAFMWPIGAVLVYGAIGCALGGLIHAIV